MSCSGPLPCSCRNSSLTCRRLPSASTRPLLRGSDSCLSRRELLTLLCESSLQVCEPFAATFSSGMPCRAQVLLPRPAPP